MTSFFNKVIDGSNFYIVFFLMLNYKSLRLNSFSEKRLMTSFKLNICRKMLRFRKVIWKTSKLRKFPLPQQLQIFRNYLWINLTKSQTTVVWKKDFFFLKEFIRKKSRERYREKSCKMGLMLFESHFVRLLELIGRKKRLKFERHSKELICPILSAPLCTYSSRSKQVKALA